MRRLDAAPLALARAAVRHRPTGWALLALGIALAAFLPVFASGLRTEASVAAVRGALEALPSSQRAVLAVTSRDLRDSRLAEVDGSVRAGLGAAGLTAVRQVLTFRPLAVGATNVTVGAVDALAGDVRLISGRLPARCRPSACEVLLVQSPLSSVAPDLAALRRGAGPLGLVVTGQAELIDQRLVGTRLVPPALPMLLGADPAAICQLESLTLFGRNTAWYGTLDGGNIAARGVPSLTRALADVAATVNAVSGPLIVSWPVDDITAAGARADASADRFAVLGAGAGALQLGFCVLVAAAMRRRQQLAAQVLIHRGASLSQLLVTTAAQALLAVAAGLVLGVLSATLVLSWRLGAQVEDPGAAAVGAASSSWVTLVALASAAVVIVVLVARWPSGSSGGSQQAADAALVGMVAVTALLLWGTSAGVAGPYAPSVVVLVSAATGLLAARLWRPLLLLRSRLRPTHRRSGSTAAVVELSLRAGRRRPLLPMVTAGFVAATVCSLVFTGSYWATLLQSATDQAAAQVPLDVRIGPSAQVAVPVDVLGAPRILAAGPGVQIHPVVSSPVTVFAGSTLATSLPLTGIAPEVLPQVHEFASVTGADLSAAELAARLRVSRPRARPPAGLPAGTRQVSVRVRGITDAVTVSLWLGTPEGRQRRLTLSGTGPVLTGDLRGLLGGRADQAYEVRALEVNESDSHLALRQHGVGEGSTDRALAAGRIRLGPVRADGRPLPWSWSGWGSDQAQVRALDPQTLSMDFRIADFRVVLTPDAAQGARREALPVAVDPDTATRVGSASVFGVTVNGQTVPARVVAVLPRMPTLGRTFLLADQAEVVSLLDRSAPGTATVSQVWIAAPGGSVETVRTVLGSSSASTATLSYRAEVERGISTDPVTTLSLLLLVVAGGVALLLAMVGVATAVRSDLETSAADSFAMELDGVTPRSLRAVLRARSLSTLAVGVPVGVAGGLALAAAATRLLVTGPGGTPVVPPLRLVVGTWPVAAVAAAAVLGGLLACLLASGSAFREPRSQPPELDLR